MWQKQLASRCDVGKMSSLTKWYHVLFDKNPHGRAEAWRSAWRWNELGTQVCFLTICFEQLMQQESKRRKHPNQHFPTSSGFTTATSIKTVRKFLCPGCLTLRCWYSFSACLPDVNSNTPKLSGYCTIKINHGEQITSLTVIHVAVRQLLNGLLLEWPLAFPLNRCSDDAPLMKWSWNNLHC